MSVLFTLPTGAVFNVTYSSFRKAKYKMFRANDVGQDSAVGIATRYSLNGPGIESWWGARFSAPVLTGPQTHPPSCKIDTGFLFQGYSGRGLALITHSYLGPRLQKE
jgi:hypothetical protein